MPYAVTFQQSPECERELVRQGFEKQVVFVKWVGDKGKTERELASMKIPPYQFAVTDFWGMGAD